MRSLYFITTCDRSLSSVEQEQYINLNVLNGTYLCNVTIGLKM